MKYEGEIEDLIKTIKVLQHDNLKFLERVYRDRKSKHGLEPPYYEKYWEDPEWIKRNK